MFWKARNAACSSNIFRPWYAKLLLHFKSHWLMLLSNKIGCNAFEHMSLRLPYDLAVCCDQLAVLEIV